MILLDKTELFPGTTYHHTTGDVWVIHEPLNGWVPKSRNEHNSRMTSLQGHGSALNSSQLLSIIIRSFLIDGDPARLVIDSTFISATLGSHQFAQLFELVSDVFHVLLAVGRVVPDFEADQSVLKRAQLRCWHELWT
jgi:hypothetical protein